MRVHGVHVSWRRALNEETMHRTLLLISIIFAAACTTDPNAPVEGAATTATPLVPVAPPPGTFGTLSVTNGTTAMTIAPSGNTIWDFDATPASNTSAAQYRFFRNTNTTGEVSLTLQKGDGTALAPQVKIGGNVPSFFRMPVGFANTSPKYHVDVSGVNETGQTASNRLVSVDTVNSTFDTTAGPLSSYGGYFYAHATRSAGSNPLTNVGVYAQSTTLATPPNLGNVAYAAFFDKGDVRINGHLIAGGTAATVSACGTGATIVGDDKAGTITVGTAATGCTLTFATKYSPAPSCVVTGRAGVPFASNASTNGITVTNVTGSDVSGTQLDYLCNGH